MTPGRKDKRPPARIYPSTIEAALDWLDNHSDPEVRATLRDLPDDRLIEAYRDFGMNLRASLGLWGQNAELIAALPEEHRFADHASMFLLEKWRERLRGS